MGWKIIFAPQALEELEQIVRFIAQDDPQAAIRFGDYLVDRADSLTNFPELGTLPETSECSAALVQIILHLLSCRPEGTSDRDYGLLALGSARTYDMTMLILLAHRTPLSARLRI
jgi:plasmid stabilization system protein ParE